MYDDELKNTVNRISTKVEETSATVATLGMKVEATAATVAELTKDVARLMADSKAAKAKQVKKDAKKSNKTFNKTRRKIDKAAKIHSEAAETFFLKTLKRSKELLGLKFHVVRRNVGTVKEFDIVMVNDDIVVVISVKHILHVRDVKKFAEEDLKKVPLLFPEFRSYKLYGGVAGMHVNADARGLAEESGLIVLGQAGQNVAVLNERGFEPRVMNN